MAASSKLIIVESPAKARTIAKFLGRGYKVEASQGHVRDMPKSQLGVDVDNNFAIKYITIHGRGKILAKIRKEAKNASKIYLATDPDREGEAISWHLAQTLDMDVNSPCRIEFHEITQKAVENALKNPRPIDLDKVDAQQARRALDRLIGYKISPLLWAKVKKGLSAGRVQSVATRLVVDREQDSEDFIPEEYTTKALADGLVKYLKENGKTSGAKTAAANVAYSISSSENVCPCAEAGKLLIPRAKQGSKVLTETLAEQGYAFDDIPIYDILVEQTELARLKTADYITFESGSGVRGFFAGREAEAASLFETVRPVCIGKVTAAVLTEYGVKNALTASDYTADGILEVLLADRNEIAR